MIDPESVQVGQCYLTDGGHIRRVIRLLPDGRVQYEHRSALRIPKTWASGVSDHRSFAFAIERPVPCDWTPETDG